MHLIAHSPSDGKCLLIVAWWLEADSDRRSPPGRRGTGRVGWCVVSQVGLGQGLLQHWFPTVDLCYDGIEFLAVFGAAAIGSVVAVPTGGGVDGVEVGKVDGSDVAGGAVDQEPSAALPVWWPGRIPGAGCR